MDLHNLHNPSPCTRQQAPVSNTRVPACQDVSRSTHAPAFQDASRSTRIQASQETSARASDTLSHQRLQDARERAIHWQNEAHKMDKIAAALTDELAAKKQARKALKAELEATRLEAETWQARCRQAMAKASTQTGERQADTTQKELATTEKELAEARAVGARIQKELAEARAVAAQTQADLAEARELAQASRRELARQAAELPGVQERLQIGGEAFRKLKTLEPMLRQAQVKEKHMEEALAAATARTQQADLELAASKERLRAAAQGVLAGKCQADALTSMLKQSNQVLQTCSQLFTGKQEHTELAEALRDTTTTISSFLATLADHPH